VHSLRQAKEFNDVFFKSVGVTASAFSIINFYLY